MTLTWKHRIIFFPLGIFLVAIIVIGITTYWNAEEVRTLQRESIERTYKARVDTELKNNTTIAARSIEHLQGLDRNDETALEEAKRILAKLNYEADGYFFLYDLNGTVLMHPRQPDLVGQNLWNYTDANGNHPIQQLINRAQQGGGHVDFEWQKPSTHSPRPVAKRAYVILLKNWGWVLGTGVYLDDVEATLAELNSQMWKNINGMMCWIVAISALCVGGVVYFLWKSIKDLAIADIKLKALSARITTARDEERHRIASDLHDGIKLILASIKMDIEVGINRLQQSGRPIDVLPFETAIAHVDETLQDIDRIVQGLRPSNLDTLGLEEALRLQAESVLHKTLRVKFAASGETKGISSAAAEALFFVARQALANAIDHSSATVITLELKGRAHDVVLQIHDDGRGFNVNQTRTCPGRGLGLYNMEDRMKANGGTWRITSSPSGTTITATIPKS
ncbi:MAG: cache domain-containing protein [Nitrospira sp.]|nr:cache domain-containing protein [Nitrospira sp.]